jgi:hypothetical protein
MPNESWELRWFFPGEIPQTVESWLEDLDEVRYIIHENSREDKHLLPINACRSIGIKLREGRMQVKWLKQIEPFMLPAKKIQGSAENWLKWTWINEEGQKDADLSIIAEHPEGPGMKIEKNRKLRVYGASSSGLKGGSEYTLRHLVTRQDGILGCLIELTSLRVRGEYCWSIAFETFGSDDSNLLKLMATRFLSGYAGPQLTRDNSYGYPKWLTVHL